MSTKSKGFFKKLLSSVLSAACLFSGTAVLSSAVISSTAPVEVSAAAASDAPPFSWDNATVYFLLTDRFNNGNTSNDHSYGRGCDQNGNVLSGYKTEAAFQGGDFAGITQKINDGYFTDLGVNAIWLSAPYEQIHGYVVGGNGNPSYLHYAYHGYYVLDYTETDKNFGTKEEFKTMVDTAHEHGIRIVLDIVMNHAGYNDLKTMSEYNFCPASGWESYYYSHQNTNNTDYHGGIDYTGSADVWRKWWGPDWIRAGLPGGYEKGGGEVAGSLEGLPDFKTESGTTVGIPEVLKTKWTKEGTYDAKVAKYGSSGTVRSYLVKWLTEWVKEYGVDGFRCDTAKHVEMESWKALKDAGKAALKEWRQNNPSAPGANWTDDFWMTGECFGHRADKSNYFTSGAFDSMINFSFTGVGQCNVPAAGSVDGVYSDYATKFNNDPSFNMLTYLASHDTTLITGDRKYAGSFLLMCPGGVQIYYGDEICRPMAQVSSDSTAGAGHMFRSFMNWDSMDKGVLAHWQKLGQFRNNHLAVGAGQHKVISSYSADSGYTFSRTYSKGDIDDKVVVTLFAPANKELTIDVNGVFAEGTEVTNFYDDTTCKVSGGKVTFNTGANGTILIQEPSGKKGRVNVTHINKDTGTTIKTETMSGLIGEAYTAQPLNQEGFVVSSVTGSKTGTFGETEQSVTFYYTFDSSNYAYVVVKHVDASSGAEIAESETKSAKVGSTYSVSPATIKDYEVDLTKSDSATGTVKSGTNTVTFKYNYVEPTSLRVHYYNANNWASVNMYAYTGDDDATAKRYLGEWPGKAMTSEGDGWFVCDVPDVESARVLFNAGYSGPQEPAQDVPGYQVSGEVWLKNGKTASAGKVVVVHSGSDGKTLATETLKGMSGESYTTSAKTFTGYTLESTPSNASGTFSEGTVTVTYTYKADAKPDDFQNTSKVSASTITLGNSVTVTAASTGGSGTAQYAVYYKQKTQTAWTKVRDYATGTSIKVTPKAATKYTIRVKAKDGSGTVKNKDLTITVKPNEFANTSKVSASTITLGNSVTVTCASTGGSGTKQYAVFYKQNSQSSWTKVRGYATGTSVKVTPKAATKYTIRVKVKDGAGTIKDKDIAVTVKPAPLTNTSKVSATTINYGDSVKVTCASTGGSGTKQYAVFYIKSGQSSWTKIKGYTTATTATVTPKGTGTYTIRVKAKDGAGTVENKDFKITVKSNPLVNTSTLSSAAILHGKTVTVNCSSTGGVGTKQYAVFYKRATSSEWTTAQGLSTKTSVSIKPASAVVYDVCVKVKDANGTISKQYMTVAVNKQSASFVNSSKVSATSVTKGTKITITGASSNATDMAMYKYEYKSEDAAVYTTIKDYTTSTTAAFTPTKAGRYFVRVIALDMTPNTKVKYFTITVK